ALGEPVFGGISQPCTVKPSLFQCTLMALPHGTSTDAAPPDAACGRQAPISPVTMVGGSLKVSRIAAVVLPSAAMEMPRAYVGEARSVAAPWYNGFSA